MSFMEKLAAAKIALARPIVHKPCIYLKFLIVKINFPHNGGNNLT